MPYLALRCGQAMPKLLESLANLTLNPPRLKQRENLLWDPCWY